MKTAFDLTYVEYHEGDIIGFLSAGVSLAPVFAIVAYVSVILARREIITIAALAGQLGNTILNVVIKKIIDAPRPDGTHLSGPGMPSNHSQFVFFTATFWSLHILNKNAVHIFSRAPQYGNAARLIVSAGLYFMAFAVAFSRVYLDYHFAGQVFVGSTLGILIGGVWYKIVQHILLPLFRKHFADSFWCRFMLIRDSHHVPDILQLEYHTTRKFKSRK